MDELIDELKAAQVHEDHVALLEDYIEFRAKKPKQAKPPKKEAGIADNDDDEPPDLVDLLEDSEPSTWLRHSRDPYSGSRTFSWKVHFTKLCLWRVTKWLEAGGQVKSLPPRLRKYVLSEFGKKHSDKLRKRAERGDKEAQEDLDWFRYRALPKPYVPKKELASEAHSIKSNTPWDFEDRFIDSLGLDEDGYKQEALLGDTFYETYDDDYCSDGETYKTSASTHDLVRPNYTQSLNRLFGQEVDERALTKESLQRRDRRLKKAWEAFSPTWNADCKRRRKG